MTRSLAICLHAAAGMLTVAGVVAVTAPTAYAQEPIMICVGDREPGTGNIDAICLPPIGDGDGGATGRPLGAPNLREIIGG